MTSLKINGTNSFPSTPAKLYQEWIRSILPAKCICLCCLVKLWSKIYFRLNPENFVIKHKEIKSKIFTISHWAWYVGVWAAWKTGEGRWNTRRNKGWKSTMLQSSRNRLTFFANWPELEWESLANISVGSCGRFPFAASFFFFPSLIPALQIQDSSCSLLGFTSLPCTPPLSLGWHNLTSAFWPKLIFCVIQLTKIDVNEVTSELKLA